MTTAATSLLGLALPVQGELSGTWGDTVNNSITNLLDAAVAGTTTLSADADVTLTTTTLAANQAREAIILWTAGGTATRYITAPAQSKAYVVINKTSSTQSIVIRGVGPTTGVTIAAGTSRVVAWNGSDFVEIAADLAMYQPAGTGAVTTTVQAKLRQTVSIKDFGAAGDGTTNDATAVLNALQSGFVVDGGGLTYAVSGTVTPSSFVGLQNANFIQIGNNTATNFQLLNIVGLNNFFIDNVSINMGTNITTLYSDSGNSGLYVGGSSASSYSQNFKITRVSVTGNGCGTGIQIRNSKRFNVDNCLVRDRVSGSSPDPTNDSQNGFAIINCANFVLSNSLAYNLLTRLSGTDTNKWTRGFLFYEIRDASIIGCNSTTNDQGFDFSGGITSDYPAGNRRFVISGCTSNNCGTYGFKFSNVAHNALVTGCSANNTGTIGFVFSPSATTLANPALNTQNIDVVGCKVVNVLGTGWSGTGSQGFRLMSSTANLTYPRGIRFIGCSVQDDQATPTTVDAFASDAAVVSYPTTGYNTSIANQIINCSADSWITFNSSPTAIGSNIASITGSGTYTIPSATISALNWDTELQDPTGLHSVSGNNNTIFIKTPGMYRVTAQVQFAANGTGYRQLYIYRNGAYVSRTSAIGAPSASFATTLTTTGLVSCASGDNVTAWAYQNSGANLTVNANESVFSVERVDG